AYCKSVTLLNRSGNFRADPVTVEKVSQHPNFKIVKNAKLEEVLGEKFVTGIKYNGIVLPTAAIFVEIGSIPTTYFAKDLVKLNENGNVIVDPRTQRTSVEGIWAAGDCTDGLYHQNNIAAGDAVKALEDIYLYLKA
ncbi:MAG: FAD-dependent oxidoreductase, partial [Candidatus Pacebacteria bacterium]|nr:FAD-dependent oxidoreductase [Candidatus Paceibacterota bacterium]